MANQEEFDAYAGIHFKDVSQSDPNGYGNNFLRTELANHGVGTLIIPDAQAYDFDAATVKAHPTQGDQAMSLAPLEEFQIGDGGLEVVRARVFTPSKLEASIDVVNGPKLRKFGESKWAQYELAKDFMPKTVVLADDQPVDIEALASLAGDTLVVKADTSQQGKHVMVTARDEVPNAVYGMREQFAAERIAGKSRTNNAILIQEFMPGGPWEQLRPLDAANAELLKKQGANSELRMYCYVDAQGSIEQSMRFHATLGVTNGSEGGWVAYIDQDSIPKEAFDISQTVSQKILESTGVNGGYFAIDLIQGPERTDGSGSIYIREINTRDPMMVVASRNENEARHQRKMLAHLMATIAKRP